VGTGYVEVWELRQAREKPEASCGHRPLRSPPRRRQGPGEEVVEEIDDKEVVEESDDEVEQEEHEEVIEEIFEEEVTSGVILSRVDGEGPVASGAARDTGVTS